MDTNRKHAEYIVRTLRSAGHRAYIAGGAVRDMLLGIAPKDYDIATSASSAEVAALFDRVEPVGAAFGVSLVMIDSVPFEVARFRKESDYNDGRRPSRVEPASEYEDVLRRDFTINAMLLDPESGDVIDTVGGRKDLDAGIIRAVGDPRQRFSEDRLRIMRAIRFAARFDFEIEPETFAAIKETAAGIKAISPERIGMELGAVFSGMNADRGLTLLDDSGLLNILLPEVAALKGVAQPENFHPEGDVFEHTRLMLKHYKGSSPTLGFAILLHDTGKPETMTVSDRIRFNGHESAGAVIARYVLRRLKQSKAVIDRVAMLVKNHMRFIPAREMRDATFRRFIAMEGFDELLELFRLDTIASHGDLTLYNFVLSRMEETGREFPMPLLDGNDLKDLGYEPGPDFSKMLHELADAQLEGYVRDRGEAEAWLLRKYPLKPSP